MAPTKLRPHPALTPWHRRGGIQRQIRCFVRCAKLAQQSRLATAWRSWGSEGYLINQFLCSPPTSALGPLGRQLGEPHALRAEIVRRTREAVGPNFILIFRPSMIDLVPEGGTGKRLCNWPGPGAGLRHPSTPASAGTRPRVPTIATSVPRAAALRLADQAR